MSSIKINQYRKGALPKEIASELSLLSPTPLHELTTDIRGENNTKQYYFTLSKDNTLLGFALLDVNQATARIPTIFILKPYRSKTLGQHLVLHLLTKTVQHGCQKVTIECEESFISFATQLGFVVTSRPTNNSRSPLFSLENPCPEYFLSVYKERLSESQNKKPSIKNSLVLAEDQKLYHFHDETEYVALHRNMLPQAQRRIWLICEHINSPVLNSEFFNQSVIQLVKHNSQAEIRILLLDGKSGAGYFNPVINLAQRLSSYIEIRVLQGHGKVNEMVTAVDFTAGIYRKNLTSHTGFATYNNNLIAQRLHDNYEKHWQLSRPSLETRRLSI